MRHMQLMHRNRRRLWIIGLLACSTSWSPWTCIAESITLERLPALAGSLVIDATPEGQRQAGDSPAWSTDVPARFNAKAFRLGEVNAQPAEQLRRVVLTYQDLIPESGLSLQRAVLRVRVADRTNAARRLAVRIQHNVQENLDRPRRAAFDLSTTTLPLPELNPTDEGVLEADVTDLVRVELAAGDPVATFRLLLQDDLQEEPGDGRFPNVLLDDPGSTATLTLDLAPDPDADAPQ